MTWHAGAALLEQYATARLDQTEAAGVEAHLTACAGCRAALDAHVVAAPRVRLDNLWDGLAAQLDAPQPAPVERVLLWLRVPEHTARLLAATPALHLSWLLAVASVLVFAVVAAHASPQGELAFLALAPLLPLAGIATAYGPGADPSYEIALAAPIRSSRLLFVRAAAVLITSIVLAGVAALALPSIGWPAMAWLLPALALSLASLALAGTMEPVWASAGIGFGWILAILTVAVGSTPAASLVGATAQLTWASLAVITLVVIAVRRDGYDVVSQRDSS